MTERNIRGLSGGSLKIIALITMIIDHVTAVLINPVQYPVWYGLGRMAGRLSFPIYCFLLVEGYCHTRNVKNYLERLFLFALLSEIPYDLTFYHTVFYPAQQNVFFTLFFGLLLLYVLDKASVSENNNTKMLAAGIIIYSIVFLFRTDYNVYGVLLIYLFYQYRCRKIYGAGANILINLAEYLAGALYQWCGGLSAVFIWFYNGKKGVSFKYLFYVLYPLHLLVLYGIQRWIV